MPAAVRRLAALGVAPDGHPLRGIRYLDAAHQADAPFRHGDGLGVRRTVLHAALAARAAALGIPVLPVRVTAFEQHAGHVTAAGVAARYLVAADGLHSTIRRTLERETPAVTSGRPRRGPAPRYGLRKHYRVAPWTDLVEVHWTPGAEAYVTPVSADVVGIALLFARTDRDAAGGDFEAPPVRVPCAARPPQWRGPGQRGARRGTHAPGRPPPRLRPGAARRRRVWLPGRAHRRGHRRRPRPGRRARGLPRGRPPRRLRARLAPRLRPPHGASPPASCGRGTSRSSPRASSRPRSASRGCSRPWSTTPPRPRNSRPSIRTDA